MFIGAQKKMKHLSDAPPDTQDSGYDD